jgi:hypothetical protein
MSSPDSKSRTDSHRAVIARRWRSIVAFFDGVGRVAAGVAAVIALVLSVLGGIHLARDADPDPRPGPVHGKVACSNGRDDDEDGLIDFAGHDPGCSSPRDHSEKDPACSDGKDNDSDGRTDFAGHDTDCASATDISEHNPACSNGKDDDGDGFTDFGHDPQCSSPEDPRERP